MASKYLESFRKKAKEHLPGWLYDQLHLPARGRAGGLTKRKKLVDNMVADGGAMKSMPGSSSVHVNAPLDAFEPIEKAHSGIMICLWIPQDVGQGLAVEGGEEVDSLHMTLGYIKGIGNDEAAFKTICETIKKVAATYAPVTGWVGGVGFFNSTANSDGKDVFYASYNSPQLPGFQRAIALALEECGHPISNGFGFTPHITLKYVDSTEDKSALLGEKKASDSFKVDSISVCSGSFREDIPLTGAVVLKSVGDEELDSFQQIQDMIDATDWEMETNQGQDFELAKSVAFENLEKDATHYKNLRKLEEGEEDDGLRVDLGSGTFREKGHIGFDLYPGDHGTIIHDLTLGIPVPDQSVSKVRAVNALHEISKTPDAILQEIQRVLKPNGTFVYEGPEALSKWPELLEQTDSEDNVDKSEKPVFRQTFKRLALEANKGLEENDAEELDQDQLVAESALDYTWAEMTNGPSGLRGTLMKTIKSLFFRGEEFPELDLARAAFEEVEKGGPGSGRHKGDGSEKEPTKGLSSKVKDVESEEHANAELKSRRVSFDDETSGMSGEKEYTKDGEVVARYDSETKTLSIIRKGGPGSGRHAGSGSSAPKIPNPLRTANDAAQDRKAARQKRNAERAYASNRQSRKIREGMGVQAYRARQSSALGRFLGKKKVSKGGPGSGRHKEGGTQNPSKLGRQIKVDDRVVAPNGKLGTVVEARPDGKVKATMDNGTPTIFNSSQLHHDPSVMSPETTRELRRQGKMREAHHQIKIDELSNKIREKESYGDTDGADELQSQLDTLVDSTSIKKEVETVTNIPIFKADKHKQLVYGVVLSPDEVDAQDDWMDAEEIEKAAHMYMSKSRVVGSGHSKPIAAQVVESYIAPQDFEGDGQYGPQKIKKGSWVLGVRINDPEEWKKVLKGEYTGFSVGGLGARDRS